MTVQNERTQVCNTNTQFKIMFSGYQWFAEQLGDMKNLDILDAACGTGYGSNFLAHTAKSVTGIDTSDEAITYCNKNYHQSNLTFMKMDCTQMDFPKDTFNAVISQDTIEHIRNDKGFISEIKRVLKPYGTSVFLTPHSIAHNEKPSNPYHIREYSKESFTGLLKNHFPEVKLYGRVLSKELQDLENSLTHARHLDFLGIRAFIPRSIRHLIGNSLAKLRGNLTLNEVSYEHIIYTENIDEQAKTMIAVCRK